MSTPPAGATVVHRFFARDTLVFARAARVVVNDARGTCLWLPNGVPAAIRLAHDGRGIRDMPFVEWVKQPTRLTERRWWGPDILMYFPPSGSHSVWLFWDARGEFSGWYVNLETAPVWWTDGDVSGVDTTDHDLDIVVHPDRRWEWKDEDEFTERLAFPEHYWVDDEAAVRLEGERVVSLIERGAFPFDGTFCDFRPDRSWNLPPHFPDGWDSPRRRS